MKTNEGTVEETLTGKEMAKTVAKTATGQVRRRLGGTNVDYWAKRLAKLAYVDRHGQKVETPNWSVRLSYGGKREWFNLGSPNKATAAAKARDVYLSLQALGWKPTLAKFKPDTVETDSDAIAIGEYLEAVRLSGRLTLRAFTFYRNSLFTIVSEAFEVEGTKDRFNYRAKGDDGKTGNQRWAEQIEKIELKSMTIEVIERWKNLRIERAGNSPIAEASAKRTANTHVRCARSLFSRKNVIKYLPESVRARLPSLLPFNDVELFPKGHMKYESKLNARALIAAAKKELKRSNPESYKAFLLGLFAGMRRSEIDGLEWDMIDWPRRVIQLHETEYLRLKTKDSAGEISIDRQLVAELREMMATSQGRFVIKSDRAPRNDSVRLYLRAKPVFDHLNDWLRTKGVTAKKPLHELRKEVGSLVATKLGIYAASRFLRHSDIGTTTNHYAHHQDRITAGLGKLLDTELKAKKTRKAKSVESKVG